MFCQRDLTGNEHGQENKKGINPHGCLSCVDKRKYLAWSNKPIGKCGNCPPMKILSLTTLRELLQLSLPMVVSQGAYAVMVFTDRWFMSQLDAVHIAATLGGGVASFFCISLFVGILSYANALVAQYYGAKELQ